MCGEYAVDKGFADEIMGSPPHVWGIQVKVRNKQFVQRITPTCVGNTAINLVPNQLELGSPPHVWGIH